MSLTPDTRDIVINTGPLIALAAGLGTLDVLQKYRRVVVPAAVRREVLAGQDGMPGKAELQAAGFLDVHDGDPAIESWLANILDEGEAAVIQTALSEGIATVCIDETFGRRVARLAGLRVTGSIGVLIRACRSDRRIHLQSVRKRMEMHGVWVSESVWREASAIQEREQRI